MGTESPDIFEGALEVGRKRLVNTPLLIGMNGLIGGLYVTFSGLGFAVALAALDGMPHGAAILVAGLFYPIGFIFVLLGKSELFTENFLTPVLAAWAYPIPYRRLLFLWGMTLAGNLAGILAAAYAWSHPGLGLLDEGARGVLVAIAEEELTRPAPALLAKAMVGGLLISFMTWLVLAAPDHLLKLAMMVVPTYLIVVLGAVHSMVGSFEVLVGVFSGVPGGLQGWALRFLPLAALGNMAGGILFVSALHYAQAREERRTRRKRRQQEAEVKAAAGER